MNADEQVVIIAARIDALADALGIADYGTRQVMALMLHPEIRDSDGEYYSNLSTALYTQFFNWDAGSSSTLPAAEKLYLIAEAVLDIGTQIGEERDEVMESMYAMLRVIALDRDEDKWCLDVAEDHPLSTFTYI